jgi:2-polyprenyl-3-methyl-5-hydroxy-6-metoxy-1,4-benzoquinol methylase
MSLANNTYTYSENRYGLQEDFYDGLWQKYRRVAVLDMVGTIGKVLDVGCYDGTYMKLFKNNGNTVFGIDASKDGIKKAKRDGLNALQQNIESKWEYKGSSFDLVYSGEVLEHLVDTDLFIKEIHRVLKPNGFLVLTTPNLACFSKRILLFLGKNPYQEASFTFPKGAVGHLREFTYELLKEFVESNGFELVEFKTDVVSIPGLPEFMQVTLGKLFPKFGRSLIMKFRKLHK